MGCSVEGSRKLVTAREGKQAACLPRLAALEELDNVGCTVGRGGGEWHAKPRRASREVSRCPIGTPPTLVVRDVIGHTAQLGTAPPSLHSHARWFAWSSNAGVCRPCSVPHFTWAIESGGDESEGRSQLCRMFEVHRAKRGYPGLLHTDRHWGRRPTSRRRVGNCPTYQRSTVTNLTLVDLGQSVTSRVTRSRDRS